jgi:hypothetical protein
MARDRKWSIATLLLPFRFGAPVYRVPYRKVNAISGFGLHAGQHVAIEVEGDRHARMAQALLRDLRVNSRCEELCRMAMPEVMEADLGQPALADEYLERVSDAPGLQRVAVSSHCYVMAVIQPDAESEEALRLIESVLPELLDEKGR